MGLHIIITGGPTDGLTHYGPFKTYDDARAFAERTLEGHPVIYWIAQLRSAEQLETEFTTEKGQ